VREHESKRRRAGVLGRGIAKRGTCQLLCWVCMSSSTREGGCRRRGSERQRQLRGPWPPLFALPGTEISLADVGGNNHGPTRAPIAVTNQHEAQWSWVQVSAANGSWGSSSWSFTEQLVHQIHIRMKETW